MNDPVSRELENRAHLHLPWQWALLGALGIHLAVAAALLLTPSHPGRALRLPSVQVRLAPLPAPAGAPRIVRPAPAAPAKAPVSAPAARPTPHRKVEPPPSHVIPAKRPAKQAPPPEAAGAPASQGESPSAAPPGGGQTAPGGGIALGGGAGSSDEPFPFAYYLNRVLAVIESNWFRPAVPPGSRCTVRCVIDRSGRLVEAGLEQESPSPAFDRAALRAVYAAAPFPPLPQGFGGSRLTLHLEFGQ
jgi:protein TonB